MFIRIGNPTRCKYKSRHFPFKLEKIKNKIQFLFIFYLFFFLLLYICEWCCNGHSKMVKQKEEEKKKKKKKPGKIEKYFKFLFSGEKRHVSLQNLENFI
jgi:hypothetical protein